VRINAVASPLNRMVDGEPGFLLSPNCKVLRKACSGGYAYRASSRRRRALHRQPHKNRFSHPADALEYLMLRRRRGPRARPQEASRPSEMGPGRRGQEAGLRQEGRLDLDGPRLKEVTR
jgi:hypothetical protein